MALLPDPAPRPRQHVLISVDDHVIEPPDMFDGRLPATLADQAPRIVETDDGRQVWRYEDCEYPNIGLNAVVGRPLEEWSMEPARFDEMRRGCWDIKARIGDMDLAGIWASLNFPSLIAGFSGTVFGKSKDPELGLAVLRAWNDWHHEVWAGSFPERIIPLQLPWLAMQSATRDADGSGSGATAPLLDAVRADRGVLRGAFEEALRWEPPITTVMRVAARDCELGGLAIPAGTNLGVSVAAANRDPKRYPDPDRFDPTRTNIAHLTFGGGPHLCLGMHLARMEAMVAFDALLDRLPDLRLGPSAPTPRVVGVAFRSPAALPVEFTCR